MLSVRPKYEQAGEVNGKDIPMFAELSSLHQNAYRKKGISNDALLRRLLPNKYKDYSKASTLMNVDFSGGSRDIAVITSVLEVRKKTSSNGRQMLSIKAVDRDGTPFRVMFMNSCRLKPLFTSFIGHEILLMGPFQYDPVYGYSVFAPAFSSDIPGCLKVTPVYGSIKDISTAKLEEHIKQAVLEMETETIPERLLDGMPGINDAIKMVHFPEKISDPETGRLRLVLDDLVYFKLMLQSEQRGGVSRFCLSKRESMDKLINNLPYSLTQDQQNTIDRMIETAGMGKQVNALVQGDVGCGKTIIAICMMVCAVENGFQTILMAPTQILAEQHFQELIKYIPEEMVVLIDGSTKGRTRKDLESRIKKGTIKYIVGTSALLTADIPRENIGVIIVDEEHRFGVEQREALFNEDAHVITMSATPIPRSLAQAVYGDSTQIYQIRQKPAGRLSVKTYYDNGKKIKNFLFSMLKTGGQAYIICPLKEEAETGTLMENVKSAEEVYSEYQEQFGNLGYQVGLVTGATKSADKEAALEHFKSGETQILVSTTVIEVGVNVPNANVIIIMNAERFGLATLHQLRGRVGRGERQSYCILVSDKPNDRIIAMYMSNDGFEIAEADLKERRSGDLLGIRQSGKNRFVEETLEYPDIEMAAGKIVDNLNYREALAHIRKYQKVY